MLGDGWDVEGDEVGEDFGCLGGVDGCDLAGFVDGLFDSGVLTVSFIIVSELCLMDRCPCGLGQHTGS